MITYALLENHLTADPDDYMAVVQPSGTATEDDLIEHIIQQGSTVTRADILSVVEDYATAVIYMVLDGKTVTTSLANFGVAIKGVFDGKGDSFDPSRHQLRGTVSAGKRYRKEIPGKGKTGKAEARIPAPNPEEYNDLNTGERNGVLTSAGMGQIVGHRLKFDPADDNQGIFFVAEDGSATQVDVIGRNKPAELMFTVPTLASGDYRLEVRAAVYGSQQVRTGALPMTLTVS
jgi:hypothetical protein